MGRAKPPIWIVLKAHLRADPRKTTVLVVLFVVIAVVYGRWLFKPSTARSAEILIAGVEMPVLEPETRNGRLAPVDRVTLDVKLHRQLPRDPFAMDWHEFPGEPGAKVEPTGDPDRAVATDTYKEFRAAAEALMLQSTLCSKSGEAMACINGQFVRAGEFVEGFRVERVEPARVVIRRGDFSFALVLK